VSVSSPRRKSDLACPNGVLFYMTDPTVLAKHPLRLVLTGAACVEECRSILGRLLEDVETTGRDPCKNSAGRPELTGEREMRSAPGVESQAH